MGFQILVAFSRYLDHQVGFPSDLNANFTTIHCPSAAFIDFHTAVIFFHFPFLLQKTSPVTLSRQERCPGTAPTAWRKNMTKKTEHELPLKSLINEGKIREIRHNELRRHSGSFKKSQSFPHFFEQKILNKTLIRLTRSLSVSLVVIAAFSRRCLWCCTYNPCLRSPDSLIKLPL